MAESGAVQPAGEAAPPRTDSGAWLSLDEVLDQIEHSPDPVVALSITGGGASGAYQAGVLAELLAALARRPSRAAMPRVVVGTSAGALNAFALLLDAIRPAGPARVADEPLVAALWRTIGARNLGARFVTGARAKLVSWVTRWRKWKRLQRAVALAAGALVLALVNPVLFALVARDRPGLGGVASAILAHPVAATLAATVALVAAGLALTMAFGRALFGNQALRSTLATAAAAALDGRAATYAELSRTVGADDQQRAAQRVVQAWREAKDVPELIVTATDLSARWECLFALASRARCERLAAAGWEVGWIGGDAAGVLAPGTQRHLALVHESELLRCVVASTSIPGVFPSQRIRLHRLDGSGAEHAHDFVDGGVLNNSPMNVAVDAGATHVISIELDPLTTQPPLDAPPPAHGEPGVAENLGLTFGTLLDMATTEDVLRTVAVNQMLAEGSVPGMRVVEIFRIAPAHRDLQTLDFNGHYDHPFSAPSPTLVEWLERGALDVRGGRPFWRATQQPNP